MTLDNKVAIVTGATKGMAKAGADIVVVSRNQKDCDDIALKIHEMGRRSIGIATDVTKNEQIQDLVKRTIEQFGEINILVNNAGGH
ncbi:MAG: SDR family NAD(P)-dependent oxidoreductase [Negativicutes bacterium]